MPTLYASEIIIGNHLMHAYLYTYSTMYDHSLKI